MFVAPSIQKSLKPRRGEMFKAPGNAMGLLQRKFIHSAPNGA